MCVINFNVIRVEQIFFGAASFLLTRKLNSLKMVALKSYLPDLSFAATFSNFHFINKALKMVAKSVNMYQKPRAKDPKRPEMFFSF